MDKTFRKVTVLREKSELNCMMGLFNILESCQVRASRKLISSGKPMKKHNLIDYPRNPDQIASFDEECRKIRNEPEMSSVSLEASVVEKNKNRRARKKIQKGYNAATSTNLRPSTSEDVSLKGLTIAAILSASYNQDDYEESKLSEIRKSIHLDQVEDFNMRQVQMRAKLYVDQLFIERNFVSKGGSSSELKPFSKSLEILNSNKDFSMEVVLKEPKNVHPFHTTKDINFFELDNKDLSNIHGQSRHRLATEKEKINEYSKKIVILKPGTTQNRESSDDVACLCSSLQPHKKLGVKEQLEKSTSFSFREMKNKLKSTLAGSVNEPNKFSMDCYAKKEGNKFNLGPVNDTVRKKLDFSSVKVVKKQEFDVALEGKWHLSERLKKQNAVGKPTTKISSKTLERILSSPEHNARQNTCSSQLRPITEVTSSSDCNKKYIEQVKYNMESNDESKIVETPTSTMYDFQSPRSSINELSLADSIKHQEEHQSPVSVLEPFFTEDSSSPTSIMFPTERKPVVRRRLDFEDLTVSEENDSIDEHDYISSYVHLVMKASCLNWDQILESRASSSEEEVIDASLFDEVEYIFPTDCCFDSKLLFDHINEVLVHAYESHSCSPFWFPFIKNPRISCMPLDKLVLDVIMKESEFYLLPRTEKRTLDELVTKDIAASTSWLNVGHDVEEIVICVSEVVLEESILDILLKFYT